MSTARLNKKLNTERKCCSFPEIAIKLEVVYNFVTSFGKSNYSVAYLMTNLCGFKPKYLGLSAEGLGVGSVVGLLSGLAGSWTHYKESRTFDDKIYAQVDQEDASASELLKRRSTRYASTEEAKRTASVEEAVYAETPEVPDIEAGGMDKLEEPENAETQQISQPCVSKLTRFLTKSAPLIHSAGELIEEISFPLFALDVAGVDESDLMTQMISYGGAALFCAAGLWRPYYNSRAAVQSNNEDKSAPVARR